MRPRVRKFLAALDAVRTGGVSLRRPARNGGPVATWGGRGDARIERMSAALVAFVKEWDLPLNPEDLDAMAFVVAAVEDNPAWGWDEIERFGLEVIAGERAASERMHKAMLADMPPEADEDGFVHAALRRDYPSGDFTDAGELVKAIHGLKRGDPKSFVAHLLGEPFSGFGTGTWTYRLDPHSSYDIVFDEHERFVRAEAWVH